MYLGIQTELVDSSRRTIISPHMQVKLSVRDLGPASGGLPRPAARLDARSESPVVHQRHNGGAAAGGATRGLQRRVDTRAVAEVSRPPRNGPPAPAPDFGRRELADIADRRRRHRCLVNRFGLILKIEVSRKIHN